MTEEQLKLRLLVKGIELTDEERIFYLNLLQSCKELTDSEIKSCKDGKGQIVDLRIEKGKEETKYEALLTVVDRKNVKIENRTINGFITFPKDKIVVEMNVKRLDVKDDGYVEYVVFDEFKQKNGVVTRKSFYDYQYPKKYTETLNLDLGGRQR